MQKKALTNFRLVGAFVYDLEYTFEDVDFVIEIACRKHKTLSVLSTLRLPIGCCVLVYNSVAILWY